MTKQFDAIAFDFGNTLCPWDDVQYWQVTRGAMERIRALAPGSDFETAYRAFSHFRDMECARNLPLLRENDLPGVLRSAAEEVAGRAITDEELQDILRGQIAAFVSACKAPEGLVEVLERLSGRYRLAVLSNYSLPEAVHLALEKMGIARYFDPVVVSGDVGMIKPSRKLFGHLLSRLGFPPEKVLFVGDDWLADIVGACGVGMPSVQVTGYTTDRFAEKMDAVFNGYIRKAMDLPGYACWKDAKPVAVLDSVFDLERWLNGK